MGISNGVGTLAGMLCPVAVEFLTKEGVSLNIFGFVNNFSFIKDTRRMGSCISDSIINSFWWCYFLWNVCIR